MTRTRFALRRVATALVVAGIVAAQAAHAQVTLNFVNADIDQVAKAIGAATGKTIIVDPRVKGQLNLVAERPVPEDQALKTLQSALRMQGFALVQDHGVLKVVPEADAKLQGVPTYIGNAPQARGDQVVTQVFELRNESANNLLPVLRPLISPNNTITAYPANNTIVVTDYADNVRRIAQIIAGVDSAAGSQVAVVPLKNANAIDIAAQLTKLLDPGAIGNTDATLKVTVQADPRTNALLLRASNAQRLAAAKKIAQQLDAPSGVPGNMHVVPLRNAEAVKLAKTLRGMLGKGGGESGSSASSNDANAFNQGGSQSGSNFSTGASGTPPLPSGLSSNSSGGAGGTTGGGGLGNAGLLGGDKDKGDDNQPGGMIQADAASNSLIITASDPVYRNLRAVIDQLDARRGRGVLGAARDEHLGDRRDRCERFAAEPERRDRLELGERADLARRVAHQRERQLVGGNPAAVVGDRNALDAAFVEQDAQRARAGGERVLDELLDDGGGPLDHFARRDLADQLVGQRLDRAQRARGGRRRVGGRRARAARGGIGEFGHDGDYSEAAWRGVAWRVPRSVRDVARRPNFTDA